MSVNQKTKGSSIKIDGKHDVHKNHHEGDAGDPSRQEEPQDSRGKESGNSTDASANDEDCRARKRENCNFCGKQDRRSWTEIVAEKGRKFKEGYCKWRNSRENIWDFNPAKGEGSDLRQCNLSSRNLDVDTRCKDQVERDEAQVEKDDKEGRNVTFWTGESLTHREKPKGESMDHLDDPGNQSYTILSDSDCSCNDNDSRDRGACENEAYQALGVFISKNSKRIKKLNKHVREKCKTSIMEATNCLLKEPERVQSCSKNCPHLKRNKCTREFATESGSVEKMHECHSHDGLHSREALQVLDGKRSKESCKELEPCKSKECVEVHIDPAGRQNKVPSQNSKNSSKEESRDNKCESQGRPSSRRRRRRRRNCRSREEQIDRNCEPHQARSRSKERDASSKCVEKIGEHGRSKGRSRERNYQAKCPSKMADLRACDRVKENKSCLKAPDCWTSGNQDRKVDVKGCSEGPDARKPRSKEVISTQRSCVEVLDKRTCRVCPACRREKRARSHSGDSCHSWSSREYSESKLCDTCRSRARSKERRGAEKCEKRSSRRERHHSKRGEECDLEEVEAKLSSSSLRSKDGGTLTESRSKDLSLKKRLKIKITRSNCSLNSRRKRQTSGKCPEQRDTERCLEAARSDASLQSRDEEDCPSGRSRSKELGLKRRLKLKLTASNGSFGRKRRACRKFNEQDAPEATFSDVSVQSQGKYESRGSSTHSLQSTVESGYGTKTVRSVVTISSGTAGDISFSPSSLELYEEQSRETQEMNRKTGETRHVKKSPYTSTTIKETSRKLKLKVTEKCDSEDLLCDRCGRPIEDRGNPIPDSPHTCTEDMSLTLHNKYGVSVRTVSSNTSQVSKKSMKFDWLNGKQSISRFMELAGMVGQAIKRSRPFRKSWTTDKDQSLIYRDSRQCLRSERLCLDCQETKERGRRRTRGRRTVRSRKRCAKTGDEKSKFGFRRDKNTVSQSQCPFTEESKMHRSRRGNATSRCRVVGEHPPTRCCHAEESAYYPFLGGQQPMCCWEAGQTSSRCRVIDDQSRMGCYQTERTSSRNRIAENQARMCCWQQEISRQGVVTGQSKVCCHQPQGCSGPENQQRMYGYQISPSQSRVTGEGAIRCCQPEEPSLSCRVAGEQQQPNSCWNTEQTSSRYPAMQKQSKNYDHLEDPSLMRCRVAQQQPMPRCCQTQEPGLRCFTVQQRPVGHCRSEDAPPSYPKVEDQTIQQTVRCCGKDRTSAQRSTIHQRQLDLEEPSMWYGGAEQQPNCQEEETPSQCCFAEQPQKSGCCRSEETPASCCRAQQQSPRNCPTETSQSFCRSVQQELPAENCQVNNLEKKNSKTQLCRSSCCPLTGNTTVGALREQQFFEQYQDATKNRHLLNKNIFQSGTESHNKRAMHCCIDTDTDLYRAGNFAVLMENLENIDFRFRGGSDDRRREYSKRTAESIRNSRRKVSRCRRSQSVVEEPPSKIILLISREVQCEIPVPEVYVSKSDKGMQCTMWKERRNLISKRNTKESSKARNSDTDLSDTNDKRANKPPLNVHNRKTKDSLQSIGSIESWESNTSYVSQLTGSSGTLLSNEESSIEERTWILSTDGLVDEDNRENRKDNNSEQHDTRNSRTSECTSASRSANGQESCIYAALSESTKISGKKFAEDEVSPVRSVSTSKTGSSSQLSNVGLKNLNAEDSSQNDDTSSKRSDCHQGSESSANKSDLNDNRISGSETTLTSGNVDPTRHVPRYRYHLISADNSPKLSEFSEEYQKSETEDSISATDRSGHSLSPGRTNHEVVAARLNFNESQIPKEQKRSNPGNDGRNVDSELQTTPGNFSASSLCSSASFSLDGGMLIKSLATEEIETSGADLEVQTSGDSQTCKVCPPAFLNKRNTLSCVDTNTQTSITCIESLRIDYSAEWDAGSFKGSATPSTYEDKDAGMNVPVEVQTSRSEMEAQEEDPSNPSPEQSGDPSAEQSRDPLPGLGYSPSPKESEVWTRKDQPPLVRNPSSSSSHKDDGIDRVLAEPTREKPNLCEGTCSKAMQ